MSIPSIYNKRQNFFNICYSMSALRNFYQMPMDFENITVQGHFENEASAAFAILT